jgi:integrase
VSVKEIAGAKGVTYSVRWRPLGRQAAANFKTKRQATRADALTKVEPNITRDALAARVLGDPFGIKPEPARGASVGPTMADLWAIHAATRTGGVALQKRDQYIWRSQCAEWHMVRVKEVTVSGIRLWLAELGKSYAPATVAAAWHIIRALLLIAEQDEIITRNPARFVKPPKVPAAVITERDVLTPDEALRVLAAAAPRFRALFGVMIYTGCRLSEALGLTSDALDLDADVPTVRFTRRQLERAGRIYIEGGLKTGNSDPRTLLPVPLPPHAVELLREHLAAFPTPPGESMFVGARGAHVGRADLVRRFWYPAIEAAGVQRVTLRNLRHTAITHGLAAGIPSHVLAARVGHAKGSRMTLDRYARVLPQHHGDAAERLEAYYAAHGEH